MFDLEQIKANHPLSEICEKELGQPTRTGDKLFWCCPFHDESSPSFMVDKNERYHCFGCGESGDLFDFFEKVYHMDLKETIEHFGGEPLTPEITLERTVERAKRQQERLDQEIKEAERALVELREAQAWAGYHTNLLDHEEIQRIWEEQGLPFDWQVNYDLGYAPNFWGGESITIPVFTPFDRDPVNIRHRLLNPNGQGKYLPETRGLPASFYWARPKLGATEQVFLVEGEKKAMVLFRYLYEAGLENVQVVGIMGKNMLKPELVPQLANTKQIFFIPDPDMEDAEIWKTVRALGKMAYLIRLPMKPDDMLIAGHAGGKDIINMTHTSRRILNV